MNILFAHTPVRYALMGLVIMLLFPAGAAAQMAPLVSDRPDFTESPLSVQPGIFQVEGGLTFQTSTVDALTAGELLVRYGLMDRLEVRLGVPSWVSLSDAADTDGFSDASVGVKYQIGPTTSGWDVAVLGAVSLPTGDNAFSSDRVDPSALLSAGRAVNERVSLTGQVRGSIVGRGNDSILETSLAAGFGLLPDLAGFTEVLGRFQDGVDSGWQLNLGVTSLIRDGFQLDLYTGFGLTDSVPDFQIGAGFVIKR